MIAGGWVGEWSWAGSAKWPTVKRLMKERRAALNAVNWRLICDDGGISEYALPWPMERQ